MGNKNKTPMTDMNITANKKSIILWAVFCMIVILQLIPPSENLDMPQSLIKEKAEHLIITHLST